MKVTVSYSEVAAVVSKVQTLAAGQVWLWSGLQIVVPEHIQLLLLDHLPCRLFPRFCFQKSSLGLLFVALTAVP